MGIPVIGGFGRLDPGPRRFLWFIVFNVVSWQSIVGPALILFARSLEMPASVIGYLIAFMPLSMLLVGFTVPLVNRFGPKRVMFTGWLLRNVLACSVFLIPFVRGYGLHYAQYVLAGAILSFCVLRAMGSGGWLPWLHELVPDVQRGTYFSMETAITQLTSVGVALVQALLLWGNPGDWNFLMVYGIGIGAGLISLMWMALIPGGGAVAEPVAKQEGFAAYGKAFRDRPFMAFVSTASLGYASLTLLLGSSVVLYMRDALEFDASVIMAVTAAGSLSIFLTISAWGRFADYAGSAAAMFWSMLGHGACGVLCLFLTPGGEWSGVLLWAVFALASVFSAAYNVAANRAMLGYIPREHRVVYTNIWSILASLAIAVTPICAGYVIDHVRSGFAICFITTAVLAVMTGALCRRFVNEPAKHSAQTVVHPLAETAIPDEADEPAAASRMAS